jgi:RNA polymerase sigma factor (sigma-70 family)
LTTSSPEALPNFIVTFQAHSPSYTKLDLIAYNNCVMLHADAVYRFVLKQLRDEHAARDIVQDSFEKLWMKHMEVKEEKAKSYLFTTAYHGLVDYTRKNARHSRLDEDEHDHAAAGHEYEGLKEILDRGLEKLPEIQRSVLLLRDYEGYSYSEIGEITGLSESQVKVYIFRARSFLKNFIGRMEKVI